MLASSTGSKYKRRISTVRPISFHAKVFHVAKEGWGWHVVWSVEKDFSEELYLALQRADQSNLLDVLRGRARFYHSWKVYIECCAQSWSWYGNILSFELQRDRVRVQLDAKAGGETENDGSVEATFDLNTERFAKLQEALSQKFSGAKYYKSTV